MTDYLIAMSIESSTGTSFESKIGGDWAKIA